MWPTVRISDWICRDHLSSCRLSSSLRLLGVSPLCFLIFLMAMNRGSSPSRSTGSCALYTSPHPPRPITASDASPSSFSRNARCSARLISFGVKITVPDRVLYRPRK